MSGTHDPRPEFVERLEGLVLAEARRQSQPAQTPRWLPASPLKAVLAAAALVVVSVSVGGAAVAASYQAQHNERRDLLVAGYAQQLDLASQRLALAKERLQDAERRQTLGVETQDAARQARFDVVEAETQVQLLELQIAEIQVTGREPLNEVASPRVSGRDFVGDRWRIEMRVPQAALELERRRLQAVQERVDIGLVQASEVEATRARVLELEMAVDAFSRKIAIRQEFLQGVISATLAGLRVLEAEAVRKHETLKPKIAMARRQLDETTARVEIGIMAPVELAEARLHLAELEAELAKVEVDLALIRKQIAEHKEG